MINTNYQDRVRRHLIHYRKDVLNVHEMGVNGNKGLKRTYEHILPIRLSRLNIIEPYRYCYFDSKHANIKFHECFHHLNSSQALCINLFYPLIVENRLDLFAKLLNLPEGEIVNSAFEFVSDLEKVERGKTNFDFYFEMVKKARVYIELKYTEQKFGDVKINQVYKRKFEKTYLPLLDNNPYIRKDYKRTIPFLENYQLMRNLIHLGESGYVVFLYPEENHGIHKAAKRAHEEILTDKGKERFKLVTLADAVEFITVRISEERTKSHYDGFKRKYLI